MRSTAEELRAAGLLAADSAVARVTDRLGMPGSPDNARVLEAVVTGGLRFEVLPDRGFDVGAVEHAGLPVAWRSPVQDARALSAPAGDDWLSRFTGGLLVTCGLGSIGAGASAPLHGDFSHRPASAIRIAPSRGRPRVSLRADVESESVFGPALRVQRRIRSGFDPDGRPFLDLRDRVVNTGVVSAPVHLLYHVNLGAPLVVPGTRVELPAATTTPRDDASRALDSRVLPAARTELSEAVFHHAPEDGPEPTRAARVVSPDGQAVELAWSHATLPHLHQWVLPTRGRWALALEPATVALPGECFPRTPPPVLAPGDRRTHRLRLTLH